MYTHVFKQNSIQEATHGICKTPCCWF